MDYEVLMLSRIKETWEKIRDNTLRPLTANPVTIPSACNAAKFGTASRDAHPRVDSRATWSDYEASHFPDPIAQPVFGLLH